MGLIAILACLALPATGSMAPGGSALAATAAKAPAPQARPRTGLREEPDSQRVSAVLAGMDLQEKVGQVLMSYPPLDREAPVRVGGVVMVGNLLRDAESVRTRVADLQARAEIPLLVAADVEGGDLNRLGFLPGLEDVPSGRELASGSEQEARAWGSRVGAGMRSLGMNTSLAPVLDLADSGMMHETGRSMGADAERVAAYARAWSEGLAREGVLAVGKHYPGYGDLGSNTDHHLLTRSVTREALATEIRAFELAGDSLEGVMLSNVGYDCYGGLPAIITPALVDRARARGWITVTDDLAIEALADSTAGDPAELLRAAFYAGNDILLTTAPPDWDEGLDYLGILEDLVRSDDEARRMLDGRVRRVLEAKDRLGLLDGSVSQEGG